MSSLSREHLLGYLLGALERAEEEQVQAELDHNPTLRDEMCRLQACLGRLGLEEGPELVDPPADLAARTCRLVALEAAKLRVASRSRVRPEPPAARRFTWSDLIVAAAVLVAAASLFFPALSYTRFQSQIAACQNQLRLIGFGLHQFSDLAPDHSFPGPEPTGNRAAAGVVAPMLVKSGFVPGSQVFLCPSSLKVGGGSTFTVPTLDEIDRASGTTLIAMQRRMGGDYGYNMGYVKEDTLTRACNLGRSDYALVADAPSDLQPGRCSANHRGRGQNMVYEDGHVNFVLRMPAAGAKDDPFHNREGWVAAGLDSEDAVLGASSDQPLPMTLEINGPTQTEDGR